MLDVVKLDKHIVKLKKWKNKNARPDDSLQKKLEKWRENHVSILYAERIKEYLTQLGPDWYITELEKVIPSFEAGKEFDDHYEVTDFAELNRKTNPLPEYFIIVDGSSLQMGNENLLNGKCFEYLIRDNNCENRYSSVSDAVSALIADLGDL